MVTIHDVARTAGVSTATVSRALANSPRVAEATRERVASVASSLGYSPNVLAAALRAGRTGAIGLLVSDLSNPFF
ncbi:MAG TPA: LacI family transcriptional regulator, partial [Micrococcales bacterium]|nr:LacI family transcriptional regulator [Micrococcales bacterium]